MFLHLNEELDSPTGQESYKHTELLEWKWVVGNELLLKWISSAIWSPVAIYFLVTNHSLPRVEKKKKAGSQKAAVN